MFIYNNYYINIIEILLYFTFLQYFLKFICMNLFTLELKLFSLLINFFAER